MSYKRLDKISDYVRHRLNLRFKCGTCGHVTDVNAIELARTLRRQKLSLRIETVERRARCSQCGERRATVTAVATEW